MTSLPCVIVGGGPAAISAALWLCTFETSFYWFAGPNPLGGMLHRVNNRIRNFPPLTYDNGKALAQAFAQHLDGLAIPAPRFQRVLAIEAGAESCRVVVDDGTALDADTVILATGTSYRTLGVPGEADGLGTYVSQSAMADAHRYAGRPVAVVGGGDAGFENALRLAQEGCEVFLLLRNPTPRARRHFIEAVDAHPLIRVFPIPTRVHKITAIDAGCRLMLDVEGRKELLDVACLFVRIGVDPCLPDCSPTLKAQNGFLIVDPEQRTSHPRILAAGDVTATPQRCIATAIGSGAMAARTAARIIDAPSH